MCLTKQARKYLKQELRSRAEVLDDLILNTTDSAEWEQELLILQQTYEELFHEDL